MIDLKSTRSPFPRCFSILIKILCLPSSTHWLGHSHRAKQGVYTECGFETIKFGWRLLTFLPHVTTAKLPGFTGTESNFVISRTCLLCYGSSPVDHHYARHRPAFDSLPTPLFCKHVSFTFLPRPFQEPVERRRSSSVATGIS
jgi:hypothetical protein